MLRALSLELAEARRFARHYRLGRRVMRTTAEAAAVLTFLACIGTIGAAVTHDSPRGVVMIAEAGR